MANNQQKAVFVTEIGKPVDLGKRNVPSPAAGEILVKVAATMLLPHDTYGRDFGLFIGEKLPFVLGSNIAGTIEKTGEDVIDLKVGDAVFGVSDLTAPLPDQAGLQEYAVLNANAAAKTPAGYSHDQVATLPVNIATSWLSLFGLSGLGFTSPLAKGAAASDNARQSLVILGGGASVGKFAVQFAALAGVGRIIVVAGSGSKEELLTMGATHVVDRHLSTSDLVKEVHAITGGAGGVTHLYHSHGHDYALDIALLPIDKPSSLLSVHPVDEEEGQKLTAARPQCKAVMVEAADEAIGPHMRDFWTQVPVWLVEGKLRPGSFRVIEGLEKVKEIDEALDGYREGKGPQAIVHP